ncbi:AraC family transcriptional regulator [Streptomyces aidingensis]|uniref:AraC-type DNA-binding protein n=1 Tax=Streptomyces aidingensis TaxID=910347 RepID=A0A1I1FTF3_9ACTN|nr:AraC family transcriptional regulator [Streptomyces aidingensis]SFC02286.1 AraC-type DNA-binding protein [Streptomyces aidingensis]
MDPLAELLAGPCAQDAFLLRIAMAPPWSVDIRDRAPLSLMCHLSGPACIVPEAGDPVWLAPGDVAVARGPDRYLVADRPDRPPQIVCHPGQRCTTVDGVPLSEELMLGVRTWGTAGNLTDGISTMLIGTYESAGAAGRRLLRALPPLLVLRAADWDSPLVGLLGAEITKDGPAQSLVLDRLLDLLLVAVLREWFARPARSPTWFSAHGDPVVGHALRLLHSHPAHPWAVAELATRAGVSRAALARRFTELVGEPPMAYLTGWRLDLAADLLRDPDATLTAVARKVGYGSGFALSAAFKRERGITPRDYRRTTATAPA